MASHVEKVNEISQQVSRAFREKKKIKIFHGFSHSTRELSFDDVQVVDISELDQVLEVNVEGKYALVEANVSMDALVQETLKKGLIPLVVPEFPKITIGGGIQGGAGESSSFQYGGVHSICEEYEIVLGSGEVVTVSNSHNPDLFWGLACSYGSIGITTLAKVRLRPAKPFVTLSYLPVKSFSELVSVMRNHWQDDIDFMDAIVFSPNEAVVMLGQMTDDTHERSQTVTFSQKRDEWFYLHALKKMKESDFPPDFIPLVDYLFRYNRGAFWTGKLLFDKLKLPFTPFTRSLLDKYVSVRSIGDLLHAANNSQSGICQDFCLPETGVEEFLAYLDSALQAYPLWICPLKASQAGDRLSPVYSPAERIINIGVYAEFKGRYEDFITTNRDLEQKLMQLGGRKVLYAHQYFSPEEFWQIYDKDWYAKLRAKYFATDALPDIYETTHVSKKYKTKPLAAAVSLLRKIVSA